MALSSTKIIKVIIVTDNLEKTAKGFKDLLGTGKAPASEETHNNIREPYTVYKGENITDTPMKVESVYSDNFWFEIIEPLGGNDPWATWLKEHGTSVYSFCLLSDGPLEKDEEVMKQAGYGSVFKQEKGYEAYEYFDTASDLGALLEIKEHY
ncbi:MAG: VOC family protein [Lachnospiraceae bacterium]|nr:VOC family protein [Lachnospiraceae bacterium]